MIFEIGKVRPLPTVDDPTRTWTILNQTRIVACVRMTARMVFVVSFGILNQNSTSICDIGTGEHSLNHQHLAMVMDHRPSITRGLAQ